MQVILLEKIYKLGGIGDLVTVKPGYARNYLLPNGKAARATKENLAEFESRRADLEKAAAEQLKAAQERAEKMQELTVTMQAQASEEGKLYGSVSPADIADAITAAGMSVEKREILLPEGPIRMIGEHPINVQLHSDVQVTVTINVTELK